MRSAAIAAIVAIVALTMAAGSAMGQPVPGLARTTADAGKPLTAAQSATIVRFDARLDEPVWRLADSLTDLRQREPNEGAPVSERTVVKVARDADALYVAIRAFDAPSGVRATQLRR